MDIEYVRSRFITLTEQREQFMLLRDASTLSVSIQTITVVLYSPEQSTKE